MTKCVIILPQPFFYWNMPLKDTNKCIYGFCLKTSKDALPFRNCTLENHKTSLRLRNYISSVSYTNLLGICAITIIVNWYYEPPSTIEV